MNSGIELYGGSVDVNIIDCYIFYANRAIYPQPNIEGLRIVNLVCLYVNTGIFWDTGTNLNLINSYIDCIESGITLLSVGLNIISNNMIYIRNSGAWIGINLINSGRSIISNNYVCAGSSADSTGISISTFGYNSIVGNVVESCVSGIWLKSGVTNCVVRGNTGEYNITPIINDGINNEVDYSPFFNGNGSLVWNPANFIDGAGETSGDITVTGAALGDMVQVFPPYSLQGILCQGYVSAADTVNIRLQNETGGAIDLAEGTWKVKVIKA